MQVKRVSTRDTYALRNKVLRPGMPVETCYFDGDHEDQTFHLGAFVEGKLVSIASFYYRKNENFPEENQFQLRGMATLEEFRKQGLSRELLNFAFPIIKQNFCHRVWCNARTGARGFYESMDFEAFGDVYEIETVGPHILMSRKID